MNRDERTIARLIKAYPKSYRNERGGEIAATLLEATSQSGARLGILDVLDLVIHGMEVRLGITSERFAGRVLDAAAIPGLIVAAGLSAFLLGNALWLPHSSLPQPFRTGLFHTFGPVIYAIWISGVAGSLLWPQRRRAFASICVLTTLAAIPVGMLFFASANVTMMCVLLGFGLPCALAPIATGANQRYFWRVSSGVALFIVVWGFGGGVGKSWQGVTYLSVEWVSMPRLGSAVSWIVGISFLAICLLLILRRATTAGALVVLTAPWMVVVADYGRNENGSIGITSVFLGIMIVWLFATWLLDFRQPEKVVLGSA
jgi:hypothetical protein